MRQIIVVFSLLLLVFSTTAAQDIDGTQLVLGVTLPDGEFDVEDVRATAAVIVGRLAALEVDAYQVQIIDGRTIQVQFSGSADTQATIDALTETALLELVDLSDESTPILLEDAVLTTSAAPEREGVVSSVTGEPFETVITGADFQFVEAQRDANNETWGVMFQLSEEAGEIFGAFTEAHVGKPLGITLDGLLLSAPVVNMRLDTIGVISGNFSEEDAKQLAAQLRAGALPLPLTVKGISTLETIAPEATAVPEVTAEPES